MHRPLFSLLLSCTLVLCLNARVLYISDRHYNNRNRDLIDLLEDENRVEHQKLQLFKRLMQRLSEDEGGTYSDLQEAEQWMDNYDRNLTIMNNEESVANWDYMTNITDETSQYRDNVTMKWLPWSQEASAEATKFYKYKEAFSDKDLVRKLKIVTLCGSRPSPNDAHLTQVLTQLETLYSSAYVTDSDGKRLNLEPDLTEIMETSHDYNRLAWAWKEWRDASGKHMKDLYEESVYYQNAAVQSAGFYSDLGQQWRACNYEEPKECTTSNNNNLCVKKMVDDLLEQIRPLYTELHAYVRYKLRQLYPEQTDTPWFKDEDSPIPAHLLGNMWAQEWMISDLMQPFPEAGTLDVTDAMQEQGWTVHQMFRTAESFFTSIGLPPMTQTFWEKSMLVKPPNRTVVCHASAEDFSVDDDYRIKMCTTITHPDLQTVHHEMGHIEYFMAYRPQPQIYREGANSAFHEAIGDTIALSVMTPSHLSKLNLLTETNTEKWKSFPKRDINFLMKMALIKIGFLPFGYLIDDWRWNVFSGDITKEHYNRKWWEYRVKYQGVAPPVTRSEDDFDPGAKYHVASYTPYIRYFLSFISQFQFHKALCEAKNHEGYLYTCDIYESTAAGTHLYDTLKLGSSVPWPDAMEKLTGGRKVDASAMKEYFRPLTNYLRDFRLGKDLPRPRKRYERGWKDTDEVLDQFFES